MSPNRNARVLIVDDSVTMRAFFGAIFEKARGIDVIGTAASADEARELMARLRPNVVTLDVEMPGMSGLDFLDEIMRERPTPVIMLSSLTQQGAAASFEALERGAVDCFPKPTSSNREEFAASLCALVIAAANGNARFARYAKERPVRTTPAIHSRPFDWNGRIVAMSASTGGVDALLRILPALPADCPPIVITLQIEPDFVPPLLQRLNQRCHAKIVSAEDGLMLQRGVVQLACDPGAHAVIDRWPDPSLRLVRSDPLNGARPSASLLFMTAARTAGTDAVGVILTGMGTDGAAGLKVLHDLGGVTIAQDSATCLVDHATNAARIAGAVRQDLPLDAIVGAVLDHCRRIAAAA